MSDKANVTDYPGTCPECASTKVVMVSLGDPEMSKETSTEKTAVATVTVSTHYAFLSCHDCKHSWDLPKAGTS